ncbi:MAG: type II restriction endonuclease [Bacilli bacterium]|nr:type II restriction endonuclease [Bacilli bacterium]
MKRDFNDIMNNLKTTVADYKYYTDFDKVFRNVEKYKIELNILNSLIGSRDVETDFINILDNYPNTLKVIPLLLAVRKTEISVVDGRKIEFDFKNRTMKNEMYLKFMRETGLFDLLENNKIKSLEDYITGVEVGLDTNARKNRTGTVMETAVEYFLKQIPNIELHKEMTKTAIKEVYNINLDNLILNTDDKKDAEKKFDFVVKTTNKLYLIETNFYSGSGSKLNETARSFKSLARDIKNIKGVGFIWITDGIGWKSARGNLKETYDIMEHFYTLIDLEEGKLFTVLK